MCRYNMFLMSFIAHKICFDRTDKKSKEMEREEKNKTNETKWQEKGER